MLAFVALGILAGAVVLAEVVLFQSAYLLADLFPEFVHLRTPLVAIAISIGVCVEAIIVITALLIVMILRGRIFNEVALRLVDALAVLLIAATILSGAMLPFLPGPPALVLTILGGVLFGLAFSLVFLVLRSLLRQAAFMRLELDEVV